MAWDKIWEDIFKSREWAKYPPEELIRFIARNYYKEKKREKVKILDVGCGTGAATWYLSREGFSAFGIDGSESGIRAAKKRFKGEKLKGNFIVGDIANLPYSDNTFDCAIDIVAIQHNNLASRNRIISKIYRTLKPGGKIFSMMVAKGTWGYNSGKEIEKNTFINIKKGPFTDRGLIHFSEEKEIRKLLKGFKNIEIEISSYTVQNQKNRISHYIISAEK